MFDLVPGTGLFMSSQKPFFFAQLSTLGTGKSVDGFADVCNKAKVVFVGQYPHRCGVRVGATSTWNKAGRCFVFVIVKNVIIDLKDTFKPIGDPLECCGKVVSVPLLEEVVCGSLEAVERGALMQSQASKKA